MSKELGPVTPGTSEFEEMCRQEAEDLWGPEDIRPNGFLKGIIFDAAQAIDRAKTRRSLKKFRNQGGYKGENGPRT